MSGRKRLLLDSDSDGDTPGPSKPEAKPAPPASAATGMEDSEDEILVTAGAAPAARPATAAGGLLDDDVEVVVEDEDGEKEPAAAATGARFRKGGVKAKKEEPEEIVIDVEEDNVAPPISSAKAALAALVAKRKRPAAVKAEEDNSDDEPAHDDFGDEGSDGDDWGATRGAAEDEAGPSSALPPKKRAGREDTKAKAAGRSGKGKDKKKAKASGLKKPRTRRDGHVSEEELGGVLPDEDDAEYVASDEEYSDVIDWDQLDDEGDASEEEGGKGRGKKGGAGSRRAAARPGARGRRRAAPQPQRYDDEDWSDEDEAGVGGADETDAVDFSGLELKEDHANRPLWVTPDRRVFLETFSPIYKQAYDFLIAIAEPVCRPEALHEYRLTTHSLYAAVSVGLETELIITVLNRLSKVHIDRKLESFIRRSTLNYGKVKLVLQKGSFWVESEDRALLDRLTRDSVIRDAVRGDVQRAKALKEQAAADLAIEAAQAVTQQVPESAPGPSQPKGGPAAAAAAAAAGGAGPSRPSALTDTGVSTQTWGGRGGGGAPSVLGGAAAVGGVGMSGATSSWAPTSTAFTFGAGPSDSRAQQPGPQQPQALASQKPSGAPDAAAGDVKPPEGPEAAPDEAFNFEQEETGKDTWRIEIEPSKVEFVKERCLPTGLNYPMMEEYDFKNDTRNADLAIELKPKADLRPYQKTSLRKMFGNGRARSGIIVLPCGAGKSLTGISAATRINKSCLVLCTNGVSVDQWRYQFRLWTTIQDHQICRFTSDNKEPLIGTANVTITTYTMIAFSGKRSEEAGKIMDQLRSREWGLILLDEVHVVPAQMFRTVIGIVKAHCKLGLTATLVREDEKIEDLNFLIGPKLYEANWLDLTREGHIASVMCNEVWCPMTREFMAEYLKKENEYRKQLLYVMNPHKFRACQKLVEWHEREGHKVIVFSDNIFALRAYATKLNKPYIYGETPGKERLRVLEAFKSDAINTVFLSKVGDNSIDIPEANVLIQISSHGGSRRQEAQRLGRILRAKKDKRSLPPGAVANSPGDYNAYFYSLVSKDTQEEFYSQKRQRFLVDQGYSYKVITNLVADGEEGLLFGTPKEQQELLALVLKASMEDAGTEQLPEDQDDLNKLLGKGRKPGFRRNRGAMGQLTGADGFVYKEQQAGGKMVGKSLDKVLANIHKKNTLATRKH